MCIIKIKDHRIFSIAGEQFGDLNISKNEFSGTLADLSHRMSTKEEKSFHRECFVSFLIPKNLQRKLAY